MCNRLIPYQSIGIFMQSVLLQVATEQANKWLPQDILFKLSLVVRRLLKAALETDFSVFEQLLGEQLPLEK